LALGRGVIEAFFKLDNHSLKPWIADGSNGAVGFSVMNWMLSLELLVAGVLLSLADDDVVSKIDFKNPRFLCPKIQDPRPLAQFKQEGVCVL
jgi:hypothetical protein